MIVLIFKGFFFVYVLGVFSSILLLFTNDEIIKKQSKDNKI